MSILAIVAIAETLGVLFTWTWILQAPRDQQPPTLAIWLYALALWPLTLYAMVRSA